VINLNFVMARKLVLTCHLFNINPGGRYGTRK
jgi:hypothetical protein